MEKEAAAGLREWTMPDVATGDKDRTPRDPWLESEASKISWPTPEEIQKMDLNLDMFDVERFNSMNEERTKNVSKLEKENYIKDGKWQQDALDEEMSKFLTGEEQKEYNRRIEMLDSKSKTIPEPGSGIDVME